MSILSTKPHPQPMSSTLSFSLEVQQTHQYSLERDNGVLTEMSTVREVLELYTACSAENWEICLAQGEEIFSNMDTWIALDHRYPWAPELGISTWEKWFEDSE